MGIFRKIRNRLTPDSAPAAASSTRLHSPTAKPEAYHPLHPQLGTLDDSDLVTPWRQTRNTSLRGMKEVHPGVFTGPLFTEAWCQQVCEEVAHRTGWRAASGGLEAPNTMHHGGVMATELGIAQPLTTLMRQQIQDFADAHLWAHLSGPLVDSHAYVVTYSPHAQADLGFHVDDSQVTLNVCLGEVFEGSELYFEGPRCAQHVDTQPQPGERFEWSHTAGVAVIHAGKNRHGVRPIHNGRRVSLIAWFRDASGRQRWDDDWAQGRCPPWCGHPPA